MKTIHDFFSIAKRQDERPKGKEQTENKTRLEHMNKNSGYISSSKRRRKHYSFAKSRQVSKEPQTPPTPKPPPKSPKTPPSPSTTSPSPQTPPDPKYSSTQREGLCTSIVSSSTKSTSSMDKKKSKAQQMYLDFGQASFGKRSICSICNTLIVHGLEEDESQHEKVCKEYKYGVSFQIKNVRIIYDFSKLGLSSSMFRDDDKENGYIVEIRPSDSVTLRRKVLDVKRIVDQELGFAILGSASTSSSSQDDTTSNQNILESEERGKTFDQKTVYLYIENKRVVGFCSVHVITKAYELMDIKSQHQNVDLSQSTRNEAYTRSNTPTKAIIGVHQLWVHTSHRKKSIASKLVDAARSKLVFGMYVPHNLVAFSSPTMDGAKFAKRYCDPDPPLVYDF